MMGSMRGAATTTKETQARTIPGLVCSAQHDEAIERLSKGFAGACNHPNCLVLPFRLELIRLA